jgi:hypothetical protein
MVHPLEAALRDQLAIIGTLGKYARLRQPVGMLPVDDFSRAQKAVHWEPIL